MVTDMAASPPAPSAFPMRAGCRNATPPVRLAAAVLAALLAGCTTGGGTTTASPPAPRPTSAPPAVDPGPVESPPIPPGAFAATVVRVVDGDTLLAVLPGTSRSLRIRLIGIDAPETVRPATPVACYGPQASALAHRLLSGARVRAAYEPGGRADRFGRELWDVWLPDGRFLQAVLVTAGAARAYPYRPQVRYAGPLRRLADAAQTAHRGLWGPPCHGRSFGR
ncbi:MAG: thermonuclease family protein [Mycobacteriales bacterium]